MLNAMSHDGLLEAAEWHIPTEDADAVASSGIRLRLDSRNWQSLNDASDLNTEIVLAALLKHMFFLTISVIYSFIWRVNGFAKLWRPQALHVRPKGQPERKQQ
jgi:hypothetical protein